MTAAQLLAGDRLAERLQRDDEVGPPGVVLGIGRRIRLGGEHPPDLLDSRSSARAVQVCGGCSAQGRDSQRAAKKSPPLRLRSSVPQAISRGIFTIRGMCLAQWM